jgi:hypothetical protein
MIDVIDMSAAALEIHGRPAEAGIDDDVVLVETRPSIAALEARQRRSEDYEVDRFRAFHNGLLFSSQLAK